MNPPSSNHIVINVDKVSYKKRKFEMSLPTPPPNPRDQIGDASPSSINLSSPSSELSQKSFSTNSSSSTNNSPNDQNAFEHLGMLYTLVEQIIDLRERSFKLFKRVREIERLKTWKEINYELESSILNGQDVISIDEDVGFAESLLDAMLSSNLEVRTTRPSNINRTSSTARIGQSRDQGRSKLPLTMQQRRVSCPVAVDTPLAKQYQSPALSLFNTMSLRSKKSSLILGQPKVSRWTRVKTAFKRDKTTCNTDVSADEHDEAIKHLTIPLHIDDLSPVDTVSSSSSIDDFFLRPQRANSQSKAEHDLISGSTDVNPLLRPRSYSHDNQSTSSLDSTDMNRRKNGRIPRIDLITRRLTPMLTITVPSSEKLHQRQSTSGILRNNLTNYKLCSSPVEKNLKHQQLLNTWSPKFPRCKSKWSKVKKAFLNKAISAPTSPNRTSSHFFNDRGSVSACTSTENLDDITRVIT